MARLPQVGGDVGNWGEVLNDFLKTTHKDDGSLRAFVSVTDYGAKGDGSSDDTDAFIQAISKASGGVVYIPATTKGYKLTKTISVAQPITILSNHAKLIPALSSGYLFQITASNTVMDGLYFDYKDLQTRAEKQIFIIGATGSPKYPADNIIIRNCRFKNILTGNWPDAGSSPSNTSTAIYASYVNHLRIENNLSDRVSGFGVRVEYCKHAKVIGNDLRNTGLASIIIRDGNYDIDVSGNSITGDIVGTRDQGGSIDVNSHDAPNSRIYIKDNYISGYVHYGNAVRLGSVSDAQITGNVFEDMIFPDVGSVLNPPGVPFTGGTLISLSVRPDRGAYKNVIISDNILLAGAPKQIGIYIQGDSQSAAISPYCENIIIANNLISSQDASKYFTGGIWIHGQKSGLRNINVNGNRMDGKPGQGVVQGLISIFSFNSERKITDVTISNNQCYYFDGTNSTGSTNSHIGLFVGRFADGVLVKDNIIKNFYIGIHIDPESSDIRHVYENFFRSSASIDVSLNGTKPSAGFLGNISKTLAPGSIANGLSFTASSISAPGAAIGDLVWVGAPVLPNGMIFSAFISSANTVNLVIMNSSGGSVIIGTAVWNFKVLKAS